VLYTYLLSGCTIGDITPDHSTFKWGVLLKIQLEVSADVFDSVHSIRDRHGKRFGYCVQVSGYFGGGMGNCG